KVVAPRPHRAVVLHHDAVRASAYGGRSSKITHHYRCAAVGICPISKLTLSVVTPCHHCPIHLHGQGMILPRSHPNGITDPDSLYRYIAGVCCAVAKLPLSVVTPIPYCPVSLQGNRMRFSRRNR